MKKLLLALPLVMLSTPIWAGSVVGYEPPPPPEVEPAEDADLTAALILLALIGGVVASSALTGATRGKGAVDMQPEAPEDL